ncbi:MAG: hypothetical protein V4654_06835 [Bdellovibrionota bacterium]
MKQTTMQSFMGKYANKIPKEGEMTKRIEDVTAKVPSVSYLALALGSMALSAGLAAFTQKKALANFVGLWVPSFMLIGIYNKLVKLEGHDSVDRPSMH